MADRVSKGVPATTPGLLHVLLPALLSKNTKNTKYAETEGYKLLASSVFVAQTFGDHSTLSPLGLNKPIVQSL